MSTVTKALRSRLSVYGVRDMLRPLNYARLAQLLLLALVSTRSQAAHYNLAETLRYALENSPDLNTQKIKSRVSGLNTQNARNRFLPTLDLSTQHGLAWARPQANTNEPYLSSLNLKLSETLYDNGESITLWQQAKANELVSAAALEQVRGRLLLQLVQAYYDYSRHSFLLIARKQQRALYDKQNSATSLDYRQGLKTKKDFLRFKAQAQKAVIEERAEITAVTKSALRLAELMGLSSDHNPSFELIPTDKLVLTLPERAPKVETVPEYRLALKSTELLSYDVSLAQRKHLPILTLTASGNYGYDGYLGSNTSFTNTKQYGAQVALGLSYNIWDWGTRRNEVEKANASEQIGTHQLQKVKLASETAIRNHMLELAELKENVLITNELMTNQDMAYQLIRRDYEEGRVPYVDLVQSLQDLFEAKALHYNAHYQLSQILAQHHYLEGNLYETLPH